MVRFLSIVLLCTGVLLWPEGRVNAQQAATDSTAQEAHVQSMFVRALTEAYLGDHERAVDILTNVVQIRPSEPAVLLALAESHNALGHTAEALLYASEAYASGVTDPSVYHVLASLQIESDQLSEAISTYEVLLERFPQDEEALAELGRLHEQSGHFENALNAYERLVDIAGANPALLLRMEAISERLGDSELALEILEQAARTYPNQAALQMRLAMKYRALNRDDDAIAMFEQLLLIDPSAREATLMLADLLEENGDPERAAELRSGNTTPATTPEARLLQARALYERAEFDEEAALQALELLRPFSGADDPPTEGLLLLGDLAFRNKEFELSGDVLVRALEQDPRHPKRWEQAAASFLYNGDPIQALDVVEEARILFPGQVGLLRIAAFAYARTQRPRNALRVLSEAITILKEDPEEDPNTLVRFISFHGILQHDLGDLNAAVASFDEALELIPDHALVLNNYAYILSEHDTRLEDALEMAVKANELDPDNAYFLDTLGWVYFKLGQLEEAEKEISRAIEINDELSLLHEHLGDVYDAMDNDSAARAAWNRALEIDPESVSVKNKLGIQ